MAAIENEELNSTVGNVIQIPCIQCSGSTTHEVVVSLDKSGHETEYYFDWQHSYQIIRCKGCQSISYREASHTSEDFVQIAENEYEIQELVKVFPSRIEGRKDLGDEAIYLPTDLRRIYRETADALVNNLLF